MVAKQVIAGLVATVLAGCGWPNAAVAQNAREEAPDTHEYIFDIPRLPIIEALKEFTTQSSLLISFWPLRRLSWRGAWRVALETAGKDITANTVSSGLISTDMTAAIPPAVRETIIARIPAGRLGDPDEVARVVEFLADPDSGYITGEIIDINGGLYM